MALIKTIPATEATGNVAVIYKHAKEKVGYLPNYVKLLCNRPDIAQLADQLVETIATKMDARLYELATVTAALEMEASYCALDHGKILRDKFLGPQQTEVFARDYRKADLTAAEKAMVVFVRKIVARSSDVMQEDVDELRRHGYSDLDIFNITAATTVRCFMSKLVDALGGLPDHAYTTLEPSLREALIRGRAIETSPSPE